MEPLTISREGVSLRPLAAADIDAVFEACQDPLIQQGTAVLPVPYTRADAVEFVDVIAAGGWRQGTACTWAIENRFSDGLKGVIGLNHIAEGDAVVGYWLAPAGRGLGLATLALAEACRFGFQTLALQQIRWQAYAWNQASRRVAERVGFQVSGPVRGLLNQRGQWRDGWIATLLPGDQPPTAPPLLSDGVVHLRQWRADDLAVLPGLIDGQVLFWTGFPGPLREDVVSWLDCQRRYYPPPQGRFAITGDGGEVVGALRIGREAGDAATLGWWLGPQARNRGFAIRAVRLAIAWAVSQGAQRFAAGIFAGNDASVALAERLGMRNEGLRRAYWPPREPGGPRRDTWLYSLVPGDPGWPD